MGNKWRLETPSGSDGLDFGNWRANKRGLPLTIAIAAQRPQEELGLRTGAVCISHHHLSDRQMVHKGQKSLVGPPVGAGCSDSVPAVQLPLGSLKPCPTVTLTTGAGRHHSYSAEQGPHSSGLDHRHNAGSQAVSLPSRSVAPHFGQSKSCRGSLLGKRRRNFPGSVPHRPLGSSFILPTSPDPCLNPRVQGSSQTLWFPSLKPPLVSPPALHLTTTTTRPSPNLRC